MKKMKKIFAMLLALTMILGMTMTASAETTKPDEEDFVTASVQNVEPNAEVKAYQIIEGDYGTNGFLGYKEVTPTKGTLVDIIDGTYLDKVDDRPTAEEVVTIAEGINSGKLAFANIVTMDQGTVNSETGLATYTGNLKAGYWVVLVRGTTNVYNPMLIGVYYDLNVETDGIQGSGDNNTLAPNPSVDATKEWELVATDAYAKSSAPTIEKTANVQTQNVGGTVEFDVETSIPDYSGEYVDDEAATTDVVFVIKDKMTNLTLNINSIKVKVNNTEIANEVTNYTLTATTEGYELSFAQDFILAHGGENVLVEYSAILTENAINNVPGENKAELTYTNNPGKNEGYDFDVEKVYSFNIDAGVTKQVITKVKEGVEEGTTAPLAGATFQIYTDEACTVKYSNTAGNDGLDKVVDEKVVEGVVSDAEGQLHISGLNAGTYYLKETKAPAGYSLNDTIYKIDITTKFKEEAPEELESWSIKVTNMATKADVTNNFTISNGVVEANDGVVNETTVMNIQLIALPSTGGIGTTIFTVAGCGIMIAAAFFFFAGRKKEN